MKGRFGELLSQLKGKCSLAPKAAVAAESSKATTPAAPSSSARADRPEFKAGRADKTSTKVRPATTTGRISKPSKKEKGKPKQFAKATAKVLGLLPTLKKAAPVRALKQKPKAEDFPWGSNKETTTIPSSSDNTSISGPSVTPVPSITKAQAGPLANDSDESFTSSLVQLIVSTADRFEPVSKPADRFEPVSVLPTTSPAAAAANPSLANNRPFDDDVALADAPTALPVPDFGPYRDVPEDDDSESSSSSSSDDSDPESSEDEEEDTNEESSDSDIESSEDDDSDVVLADAPEPAKEPAVPQSTA
ncbi:hypothetical protein BR93DRAFT_531140 [Coniochaeta sp. PMI_546]|nr:hypothetical protein BR93DRAFT_531140 [Coniochaeta sp. PMI_546]